MARPALRGILGLALRARIADGAAMIEHILTALAGFIVGVISATGYLGIMLMMAIESACIPLPSEVIMPFSGYLVSTGRFDLLLVATAGAIGCNLGSVVAYEIGKRGGRPAIERWGATCCSAPASSTPPTASSRGSAGSRC